MSHSLMTTPFNIEPSNFSIALHLWAAKKYFFKFLNIQFLLSYCPLKSFLYIFFINWRSNFNHTVKPRILKFCLDVLWVHIQKYFFTFLKIWKKIKMAANMAATFCGRPPGQNVQCRNFKFYHNTPILNS